MHRKLRQRVVRLGLVVTCAGGVLLLGACSRPGGGADPTATSPAQRLGSPTTVRATTGTRTPTARTTTAAPAGVTTAPAAPAANPTQTPATAPQGERYVVQPGDTLGQIAARYGVTVEAIVQANKLDDPDVLRIGQELIIPKP